MNTADKSSRLQPWPRLAAKVASPGRARGPLGVPDDVEPRAEREEEADGEQHSHRVPGASGARPGRGHGAAALEFN